MRNRSITIELIQPADIDTLLRFRLKLETDASGGLVRCGGAQCRLVGLGKGSTPELVNPLHFGGAGATRRKEHHERATDRPPADRSDPRALDRSHEESGAAYDRLHIPAPGRCVGLWPDCQPAPLLTEIYEVPDRSHFTGGEPGWEQVADYALEIDEPRGHASTRAAGLTSNVLRRGGPGSVNPLQRQRSAPGWLRPCRRTSTTRSTGRPGA